MKLHRGDLKMPVTCSMPTDERIGDIAAALGLDMDELLAKAGMIAPDVLEIILSDPHMWADVIRRMARELGDTRQHGDKVEILTVFGWRPFVCELCMPRDGFKIGGLCPECGADPEADTGELIFGKD
jgi:hypothetical protein